MKGKHLNEVQGQCTLFALGVGKDHKINATWRKLLYQDPAVQHQEKLKE
jgi:hypothetical protein